jgi:hypothetical protein
VVAPRRIGLRAALEYHHHRRRVRAAIPLSYSPSMARVPASTPPLYILPSHTLPVYYGENVTLIAFP